MNRCIMINILKLEQKFTLIKCMQIFRIIKYQKIKNLSHAYLQYYYILFLVIQMKNIIHEYF